MIHRRIRVIGIGLAGIACAAVLATRIPDAKLLAVSIGACAAVVLAAGLLAERSLSRKATGNRLLLAVAIIATVTLAIGEI